MAERDRRAPDLLPLGDVQQAGRLGQQQDLGIEHVRLRRRRPGPLTQQPVRSFRRPPRRRPPAARHSARESRAAPRSGPAPCPTPSPPGSPAVRTARAGRPRPASRALPTTTAVLRRHEKRGTTALSGHAARPPPRGHRRRGRMRRSAPCGATDAARFRPARPAPIPAVRPVPRQPGTALTASGGAATLLATAGPHRPDPPPHHTPGTSQPTLPPVFPPQRKGRHAPGSPRRPPYTGAEEARQPKGPHHGNSGHHHRRPPH